MLEMYIFECSQNIQQLEELILSSEETNNYCEEAVNEIFRIMHTIKGSSAMMLFDNIANLAHHVEDLFYFIREEKPKHIDFALLSDLVLDSVDFVKVEIEKIKNGDPVDGTAEQVIASINEHVETLKISNNSLMSTKVSSPNQEAKQHYYIPKDKQESKECNFIKLVVFFEEDCEMENIRAYGLVHDLQDHCQQVFFLPEDIIENDQAIDTIRKDGFILYIETDHTIEEIKYIMENNVDFLKDYTLCRLDDDALMQQFYIQNTVEILEENILQIEEKNLNRPDQHSATSDSIISVNVSKLDQLMDLMGEMVIAESMVTQNPDLKDLNLDNFHKAARQLHKITSEVQDIVMSIRMVPLRTTFHKMNRIARDMSKKLNKSIQLKIIGEDTEVDKNIIEHISDPLMHLVRNAIDHGIESGDERIQKGKSQEGNITLEAKNAGSDVLVYVKDDGKGLSRKKILFRAKENNILHKPEEDMTDKEVFNLIFLPGFSTNENVTEFSGRGVGMDVVMKNIESVGGTVTIESILGIGSTFTIKIPLTLAIIDGMNIKVGNSRYTIPLNAIKESFRPKPSEIISDPDSNEMIMVRGQCYPILRLHKYFEVHTDIQEFSEGILVMIEHDDQTLCIFSDELLGQQQVVVKSLPSYIKKIKGLTGCTLLGDGSISLILDMAGLMGVINA